MQWRLGNVGIRGFAPLLSLSYLSSRCMFDDQWWFFRKPGTVLLFICTASIRFLKFLHALYTVDLLCFSICSVLYCRDLAQGFVSLFQCTIRRQKPPLQSDKFGVISLLWAVEVHTFGKSFNTFLKCLSSNKNTSKIIVATWFWSLYGMDQSKLCSTWGLSYRFHVPLSRCIGFLKMFLFYDSYGNLRIFSDSFRYDNVHLELCIYLLFVTWFYATHRLWGSLFHKERSYVQFGICILIDFF